MTCARHPKVETALTCTRCATPICPDCMVAGAVGMLCRACADLGGSPLFKIRPERFALALVAGLAAGTIAGLILQQLGFWVFFIAPMVGGFLGEVVLRCTGRKSGKKVVWLTGLSVLVGSGLSLLIDATWQHYLHDPIGAVFFIVAVGLTLGAALGKIRYF